MIAPGWSLPNGIEIKALTDALQQPVEKKHATNNGERHTAIYSLLANGPQGRSGTGALSGNMVDRSWRGRSPTLHSLCLRCLDVGFRRLAVGNNGKLKN
jgi:hypothetical protein